MKYPSVRALFVLPMLWFAVVSLVVPHSAQAYDVETIRSSTGKPIFEFRYHNKGESWNFLGEEQQTSSFTLNQTMRNDLRRAGEYWANIIGPNSVNIHPVIYEVGTYDIGNADASSALFMNDTGEGDAVFSAVLLQLTDPFFPHEFQVSPIGQIRFGTLNWNQTPVISNLPQNGDEVDTFTVMTHELFHSFGLLRLQQYKREGNANQGFAFYNSFFEYSSHLYDKRGVQAKPGMTISIEDSEDRSVFVMVKDLNSQSPGYAYFKGPNTSEVIGSAKLGPDNVNGIPINGWEKSAAQGWIYKDGQWVWGSEPSVAYFFPELSHVELDNSLMSHQPWRNYTYFLEAELAILQDLGYTFDRKNNFGDSVYESDLDNWQSRHGYSARTADGKWIANAYNSTIYGVGLHVYGKNNTLTQRHDILSSGIAGTGIRVDGAANTLHITPGTRVHAVGDYSTGLLLAYGKNHHIIHRGDIAATGRNGIGIQLDFGDNMLGNTDAFRGSWMSTVQGTNTLSVPTEIAGALATSLDITGSVTGQAAAIYVADNAYVENINILRGASLRGDIISKWDPVDPRIQHNTPANLTTNLTFGLAPNAAGVATTSPDNAFSMQYTGNIDGGKSLHMRLAGGQLAFNGKANVLSVVNEGRLSGTATYNLSATSPLFTNKGVLAPGNSIGKIDIDGNFTQTSTGRLEMEFTSTGSDTLSVNGTVALDGMLTLRPYTSYYNSGQTLHVDTLFDFTSGSPTGSFAQVQGEQPLSPTLRASIIPAANNLSATAQVYRLPNAYARFATSRNGVRVGNALQGVAERAEGDMRELFTALDFSALNGSDIGHALPQLTPAPYAMLAQANAEANLSMARIALTRLHDVAQPTREAHASGMGMLADDGTVADSEQWVAWVMPIGGGSEQQTHGDLAGYSSSQAGIMGGFYRKDGDLTVGLYTALTHREMDMHTAAGAQSRTESLHLGAEALWHPQGDEGWYAWGQVQAGVENTKMHRKVTFAGYTRKNQSDWLGFSGTSSVGGGWQWRMGDMTFGPQAGLEYALNMQPHIKELHGQGSRLDIDAYTRHDLRGVAGLMMTWNKHLDEQRRVRGNVNVQWRQDVLSNDRDMHSHFVGYDDDDVTASFERRGRGSLGLSGGLQVDLRQDVTLGAYIDADVLREGYSSINGGVSLRWAF